MKVQRYSMEFELTAVKLSGDAGRAGAAGGQRPGTSHPFVLSRMAERGARRDEEGTLAASRWRSSAELKRLQMLRCATRGCRRA